LRHAHISALAESNIKLSTKLFLAHAKKRSAQTHTLANMHINCIIIGNTEVSFDDIILRDSHKKSPLFQKGKIHQRKPAILIKPDCPRRYHMPL
jgi:hypothetical protein